MAGGVVLLVAARALARPRRAAAFHRMGPVAQIDRPSPRPRAADRQGPRQDHRRSADRGRACHSDFIPRSCLAGLRALADAVHRQGQSWLRPIHRRARRRGLRPRPSGHAAVASAALWRDARRMALSRGTAAAAGRALYWRSGAAARLQSLCVQRSGRGGSAARRARSPSPLDPIRPRLASVIG